MTSKSTAALSSLVRKKQISKSGRKVLHYVVPMFATAVKEAFSSKDWYFELKLDGFRAIAETSDHIRLYSRNGLSFNEKFPGIVTALKKIKKEVVLDGEIVLLNENNKPDFQKLQHYEANKHLPLIYYVFDLLSINGRDMKAEPLNERKKTLKKLIGKNNIIRYCEHIEENGEDFYKAVAKMDMEGVIAKRCDSLYVPGVRSKDWLKIKNHQTQEAIIVGFTEPRGSRKHFGSLLLAQYGKGKELVYIGHAGTGFNHKSLGDLKKQMKPYIIKKSPFRVRTPANAPVTWLKPQLVCEIGYTEITRDGLLRHPVYKRLRPDKKANTIRRDIEMPLSQRRHPEHEERSQINQS